MIQEVWGTGILDEIHGPSSPLAQYNNVCDLKDMRINSEIYHNPNNFICDKEFNNATFLAAASEFIGKPKMELTDLESHLHSDSRC